MPPKSWPRHLWLLPPIASVMLLATLSNSASAARITYIQAGHIFSQKFSGGQAAAILDTFPSPTGTDLSTTTDRCGDPWTVIGGTFVATSGQTTVSATSSLVTGTVPLCASSDRNESAGGDMHSSGSSLFGILVNAATGGRPSTAAVYKNAGAGTVTLQRINAAGVATIWATVTGTGGGNTPRYIYIKYVSGVYTVSVNNVQVLSYTITDPTVRAAVEANNAVGIVAFNDTKSTFDNFQATPW